MANEFVVTYYTDDYSSSIVKNNIEGYSPIGIQDYAGRYWVFYWRDDKIYFIYTNDHGETWTEEKEVPLTEVVEEEEETIIPIPQELGLGIDVASRIWISFWDSDGNRRIAFADIFFVDDEDLSWTIEYVSKKEEEGDTHNFFVRTRISDDQWVTIKNDTIGCFPVVTQDYLGRFWVFYFRDSKLYYDYTDNGGTNWEGETEMVFQPFPAMEFIETRIGVDFTIRGKFKISFWEQSGNYAVEKIGYSNDGGETWWIRGYGDWVI